MTNKKNKIEQQLFDYFYSHPQKDVNDLMEIAKQEYQKASEQIVPVYKPRTISNLKEIPDEYITQQKKVREKRRHQDESTYAANNYNFE